MGWHPSSRSYWGGDEVSTGQITKVSVAIEIDGKPYFVALSQDRLKMLMSLAQGLSDGGKLPVKPLPDGCYFYEVDTSKAH